MLEIREVTTKKEQKDFLLFPSKLYKGRKQFVPLLYGDEKKIFSKDYFYLSSSEAVYFNCYVGGVMKGRISGILQKVSNEKWHQKRVRFTRFDSVDDIKVSHALFQAVEKWAIEKGMDEIVGPLGFSDMEREGLLIEGFDERSTYEEQYNFPYYQKLIEQEGFAKEIDWVERELKAPKTIDPRIKELSDKMMKKLNLHFAKFKSAKEIVRKCGDDFFATIDITYKDLYMTVPTTKEERAALAKGFELLLKPEYVPIVMDANDKVVGFGLCFPPIGDALAGTNGRLYPRTILRLLKVLRHPHSIDLGLIGLRPEYINSGISWAILSSLMDIMASGEIEYCETNLNLEDNLAIQNCWSRFENRLHKRRRSFVKKLF